MLKMFLVLLLGYAFGSIPTGVIVGRANHVDIKHEGSGNIGSTNALRTMGFLRGGLPTLVGDFAKAMIPVALTKYVICNGLQGGEYGIFSTDFYTLVAGFGTVLGHNFPFTLKFKGGKGVAATYGTMLIFSLPAALLEMIVMIITVVFTRYVSLGSIIAYTFFPVLVGLVTRGQWAVVAVACLFSVLGIVRHHANIGRLLAGKENKFSLSHKKRQLE